MMEPGTIVRLKSGGPGMTVHRVLGADVIVHWFVGGDLWSDRFHLAEIMPVPTEMSRRDALQYLEKYRNDRPR